MIMVSSTMIQKILLELLFISTVFADVIHLENFKTNEKSKTNDETLSATENINIVSSNPSAYSFGTSTPYPLEYDNSFSTTSSPLKFNSYSSNEAPLEYGKSFSSSFFTNSATAESFDVSLMSSQASIIGSSTPVYDRPFTSSVPSMSVRSSTPSSSIQYGNSFSGTNYKYLPPLALVSKDTPNVAVASFPSNNPLYIQGTKPDHNRELIKNISVPQQEIRIHKEVAVPYYIQIEKIIPYPVEIRIPDPYPVTVEKHIPYPVKINVDNPVHVPQPYPVEIEKRIPYPVEKTVPYEVKVPVDRPYPVHIPYEKPVPYPVEKHVPYPVRVNVDRPYPVENPVPYPIPVEKPVPFPVEKTVPYPVEKLVPYPIENKVPYPVKYEVPVNIPVPVEVKVPLAVDRPVPYPVEKIVPYPVQVPVEVKVPVPVHTPTQSFATVQYYKQSPISLGYETANFNQSDYKTYTSKIVPSIETQLFNTNTKPSNFYNSSPSLENRYGSNAASINYITSGNSATYFGSDQAQEGFPRFSNDQKSSDSISLIGTSNPADASSLFKSVNIESSTQRAVIPGSSTVQY